MIPRNRKPTSPGEILNEEFLKPMGVTQKTLAQHIGVDVKTINRIVNRRSRLEPELAVMLGSAFDVSPEFWMNLQMNIDIWEIHQEVDRLPGKLKTA